MNHFNNNLFSLFLFSFFLFIIVRCELTFSPGATNDPWTDKTNTLAPYVTINKSISCDKLLNCLDQGIMAGKDKNEEGQFMTLKEAMSSDSVVIDEVVAQTSGLKKIRSYSINRGIRLDSSDRWERGEVFDSPKSVAKKDPNFPPSPTAAAASRSAMDSLPSIAISHKVEDVKSAWGGGGDLGSKASPASTPTSLPSISEVPTNMKKSLWDAQPEPAGSI